MVSYVWYTSFCFVITSFEMLASTEMLYLRNLDTMPIDANKTFSVPRMEPS